MTLYESIRGQVSALDAARRYGLRFRGNRALCPWHEDSHPDLAFYPDGNCYCHACHHGGDAVALTGQVFGLSMGEAARKINEDFALGLDAGKPPDQAERRRIEARRLARREEQESRQREWRLLCRARQAADERIDRIERRAATWDQVWDDPDFRRLLAARSAADIEMDDTIQHS